MKMPVERRITMPLKMTKDKGKEPEINIGANVKPAEVTRSST